MINLDLKTKCKIDYTSDFKKQLKKIAKQGKDINLLLEEAIVNLDPVVTEYHIDKEI